MKILSLWGKGSKGKTTTINLLTKLLSNNFKNIDASKYPITIPVNMKKDNLYVLKYKSKKIGITTRGDNKEALAEDFKDLPNDCALYICATRTKGETCKYIEDRTTDGDIFWIAKASLSLETHNKYVADSFIKGLQKKANENQAEILVAFIDEMIQNNII